MIYHGPGVLKDPTDLGDQFPRRLPRSSRWSKGIKRAARDRLDGLLADCIGAWLVPEGRITEEQNGGSTEGTGC